MRMSAKDTVFGTAKQIVAEIVGDGRLAEEGARQTHETTPTGGRSPQQRPMLPNAPGHSEKPLMNENQFALLGHAVIKVWSDLPRDAQERLFAAAVGEGVMADDLAEFLHDRHPRTAHPPKPTRLA